MQFGVLGRVRRFINGLAIVYFEMSQKRRRCNGSAEINKWGVLKIFQFFLEMALFCNFYEKTKEIMARNNCEDEYQGGFCPNYGNSLVFSKQKEMCYNSKSKTNIYHFQNIDE